MAGLNPASLSVTFARLRVLVEPDVNARAGDLGDLAQGLPLAEPQRRGVAAVGLGRLPPFPQGSGLRLRLKPLSARAAAGGRAPGPHPGPGLRAPGLGPRVDPPGRRFRPRLDEPRLAHARSAARARFVVSCRLPGKAGPLTSARKVVTA